ncbi:hypothetical protein ABPG72_018511 [Tetrahymena utriculariae]
MKGGVYQKQYRETDDSFFYDDFYNPQEFWIKLNDGDKPDEDQIIFQGRLYQKAGKHKKWTAYHFELYSDKLIRFDLTQQKTINADAKKDQAALQAKNQDANNQNQTPNSNQSIQQPNQTEEGVVAEYIPINSCFLKKIKYSDNSYSNYKYGIRLQRGEHKSELFTENSDTFNKWHDEIKRFCILPKFTKKYKCLTKLKIQTLMPNSTQFFKCFRYSDSSQYCVRVVEKYSLSDSNKQALLKEIQILRKLDNPFLCRLYEIYEDENNIYLITELFQGKDMKSKLSDCLILDEKTISEIMWRLLQGLHHMHSKGIFHRDIKLENIQFRNSQNITDVCLTNFYMADFVDPKGKSTYKKCGTAGFIAPEIFKSKHYDQKIDIFSLGIVFYILMFGKMPFDAPTVDQILQLNEQCEIDFTPNDCAIKCTSSAIDLLKKMLNKDPSQRANAFQLINHTWFINMKNRGEDGRMRNNYYGMPTLSTIQEKSSEIVEVSSRQDLFYRRGENGPNNSSRIYEENNNGFETLNQKMRTLNSNIFSKVPSKYRHDMAMSKLL